MNGFRPWITGGLLALAALATTGAPPASAQIVIGGGSWNAPGARGSSWGFSAGTGTGVGMWGMPAAGPGFGPEWVGPAPITRPGVFPPVGPYYAAPVVMPAPVVVRPAPVVIQQAPVMVRPIVVPPHHGYGHGYGYGHGHGYGHGYGYRGW